MTTEVFFYHLEHQTVRDFLPSLLEKILAQDKKVLVVCCSSEEMNDLNNALWTYSDESFLPHGTVEEGYPEEQPLLLVTDITQNFNHADALVLFAKDQTLYDLTPFKRALYVFKGDSERSIARTAWTSYKGRGHIMSYWTQGSDGHWKKTA